MKSVRTVSSSTNRAISMTKFDRSAPQRFESQQFDSQLYHLMNQRRLSEARSCGSDQSAQSPVSSANTSPTGHESDPYLNTYVLDLNWNEFFRRESTVLNGRTQNALASLVTAENRSSNELVRSVWQPTGELELKPNGSNEIATTAFEDLMALADRTWSKLVRQMKSNNKKQTARSSSNGAKCCKFCKNNSEPRSFYTGHTTRNPNGEITCPILMSYRCEICNATGKSAHTRSYCPFSKVIRNSVDDVKLSYMFHNMKQLNIRD